MFNYLATMFDTVYYYLILAVNGNVILAAVMMWLMLLGLCCVVLLVWLLTYDVLATKLVDAIYKWRDRHEGY